MPECTSGEFRDVMSLELEAAQLQLIRDTIATGVPTVVVVISGRVHSLEWVAEHAAALLYAWVPGEQGGAAIADVLFGVHSPSGRLPITLPRSAGQIPIHHDVRAGGGRSIIYGDYVDGPAAPLFPFGYGKSYTKFRYSDLLVDGRDVTVTVTNSGDRPGTEVVQLFARDLVARVARPERTLVGFVRVPLEPGESRTVSFAVDPSAFAYYDEDMNLVIEPGAIEFIVGPLRVASELSGPERIIAPNDRRPSVAHVS
jgi:beta-glucosidase